MRLNRHIGTAGFTLIEMIVVLIVLGLAAGLVIARGPMRSPRLAMRAAATDLIQGLRLTRARAIATDRPALFTLDTLNHTWQAADASPQTLPTGIVPSLLTVTGQARGETGAVAFNPDGSASGGRITLTEGDMRLVIGIDWLTGRAGLIATP